MQGMRVLIKIPPPPWEGIQSAAEQLELEGIHCNLPPSLFKLQPRPWPALRPKSPLISPFVGRTLDWYKNAPT